MCRKTAAVVYCRCCGDICFLIVPEIHGIESFKLKKLYLFSCFWILRVYLFCHCRVYRDLSTATTDHSTPSNPVCLGSTFIYLHLGLEPKLCSLRFPYWTKLRALRKASGSWFNSRQGHRDLTASRPAVPLSVLFSSTGDSVPGDKTTGLWSIRNTSPSAGSFPPLPHSSSWHDA